MIAFAYTECNLSIEQFFGLSFFEWSLEVLKVRKRNEEKALEWEWDWARTRALWIVLVNANRDSKRYPKPFENKDLITLSFDPKEEDKGKRMTPEEVEAKFGKTLKNGK
jgi:hypothetical protein